MLPSLGTLKTVGSGLYNMGRGTLFMGASQGATRTGKILNAVGHAAPLAPAAVGSFKATSQQPSFQPQSTVKTSEDSPREKRPTLLGSVAEGAGYGALAGTPLGYFQGKRTASHAHEFLNAATREAEGFGFSHGASVAARAFNPRGEGWSPLAKAKEEATVQALRDQFHPDYAEHRARQRASGPFPRQVVGDALAPVVSGAVIGGLVGGARHLWNKHKKPEEKTSQTNVPLWADVGAGALTGGLAGAGSDFVGNAYMMASDHDVLGGVGQTLRDLPKALTVTPHLYADPSGGVFRQFGLARTAAGATIGAGVGAVRHALRKKESSSRGELHLVVERAIRAKLASGPGWHRPVNALSYAAFMAPYLSQRVHDNKPLTTALNAAGILGLSATSADSLAHGDGLAGYDLAGLGLMGAGMIHGALQPKHAGLVDKLKSVGLAAALTVPAALPIGLHYNVNPGLINSVAQSDIKFPYEINKPGMIYETLASNQLKAHAAAANKFPSRLTQLRNAF